MNKAIFLVAAILGAAGVSGQSLEGDLRKEGTRVRAAYDELTEVFQMSSAVIYDDSVPNGYGVVVSEDGLILVKTSEYEELKAPSLIVGKKRYSEIAVLAASSEWDVTLLKVEAEGLHPVDFSEFEPDYGSIVLSNSSSSRFRRRAQLGVVAAHSRPVGKESLAVLGIVMSGGDEDGPLKIAAVSPKSGAKDAGLLEGDEILQVAGVEVKKKEEIPELLGEKSPGDLVNFVISREIKVKEEEVPVQDPFAFVEKNPPAPPEFEELAFEVELRERQVVFPEQLTRNDMMTGEFSSRRTNFPRVMQHDTSMMPRTTGGPLITLDGKCVGMNIAFASRECTYAIPAEELQELVEELKGKAGL